MAMTNTERIQSNNAELREAIEMANLLPDAEAPVEIVLQTKTVTPNKSTQEVTADERYTAKERIQANNADLQACIAKANALPDAAPSAWATYGG